MTSRKFEQSVTWYADINKKWHLLLSSCVKLVIKRSCRLYTVDVVSFNEVSRVRPSVNRESERIYGCEARSAVGAKYTRPRSNLKTSPARPGHINITPVITAVDFGQFSLYNTGTSFLPRDAMHNLSAAYAVMRCLSVCLCICHVRELRQNE